MTANMPVQDCAGCGSKMDAHTGATCDDEPAAGNVSVCFVCGHLGVFDDRLMIREPTDAERERMLADPAISHVLGSLLADIALEGRDRP